MAFLEANIEEAGNLVRQNKTYKQIREILSKAFPEVKGGCSEQNLRLFCAKPAAHLSVCPSPTHSVTFGGENRQPEIRLLSLAMVVFSLGRFTS